MSALPSPAEPQGSAESEHLAEAFRLFNQVSAELAGTYQTLQTQVVQLTAELAAANGALRQQYIEKAALTERLTLLLNTLPAGVVVIDAADRVIEANPAACALGVGVGSLWQDIERATLQATPLPGEYQIGERRVALTVTPIDSVRGRLVLLHDITEAQRLKSQAERNERLAALGELAAQLAHQLRTPLAAALLYAGNLENPRLTEASRIGIAQKTVERLRRLERLIQDMLLFARGEALGREQFGVDALATELTHTFEPLAARRGVALRVAGKAAVAGASINGDRKALAGALGNLIDNALQAAETTRTTHGEVHVFLEQNPTHHVFRVKDNGPGILPADLARLFQPFFTTRAEGTGLGLAIARGVARAHGGGIEVLSTPGAGAEFIMTVALGQAAVLPCEADEADEAMSAP